MNASRRAATRLLALLSIGLAAGCRSPEPVARPSTPVLDPCAERLHEISGRLLLYYSLNRRLPGSLDELRTVGEAGEDPPCVCPASGEAYIYRPEGVPLPDGAGRLVLHDAAAVHNGGRWGIVVSEDVPGTPLAVGVVRIPEKVMQSIPEAAKPPEEADGK